MTLTAKPVTIELDLFSATDNCAVDMDLFEQAVTVGCADIGSNSIPLLISDGNGNNVACTGIVMVADTTRPEITCQDLTVYLDASGEATYTEQDLFTATITAPWQQSLQINP